MQLYRDFLLVIFVFSFVGYFKTSRTFWNYNKLQIKYYHTSYAWICILFGWRQLLKLRMPLCSTSMEFCLGNNHHGHKAWACRALIPKQNVKKIIFQLLEKQHFSKTKSLQSYTQCTYICMYIYTFFYEEDLPLPAIGKWWNLKPLPFDDCWFVVISSLAWHV